MILIIEVTQEKLGAAIRQYGSIDAVPDNVQLEPCGVEWDVESLFAQLVETVQHRMIDGDSGKNTIVVGIMRLCPILVQLRDLSPLLVGWTQCTPVIALGASSFRSIC